MYLGKSTYELEVVEKLSSWVTQIPSVVKYSLAVIGGVPYYVMPKKIVDKSSGMVLGQSNGWELLKKLELECYQLSDVAVYDSNVKLIGMVPYYVIYQRKSK